MKTIFALRYISGHLDAASPVSASQSSSQINHATVPGGDGKFLKPAQWDRTKCWLIMVTIREKEEKDQEVSLFMMQFSTIDGCVPLLCHESMNDTSICLYNG